MHSEAPHTVLLLTDPSGGAPGEKQTLERHGYTVFTAEVSHAAPAVRDPAVTDSAKLIDLLLVDAGQSGTEELSVDSAVGAAQEAGFTVRAGPPTPVVFLVDDPDDLTPPSREDTGRYSYVHRGGSETLFMQTVRSVLDLSRAGGSECAGGVTMQDRLGRTLDQAPVGIYESWSTGRFRSMNHEMARILGFPNADEALAHYHSIGAQLYVDSQRRARLFELLDQEGRVRNFRIDAYRVDGARISLTTNAAVIERDPERGLLIGGFVVDETRRRRAERRLAQSREEYRSVVQLAREIIVRFDLDGKWSFLNNEACRFFGAPREDLLGRRYLDYVHPDDRARTLQAGVELRTKKRPVEGFENRQWTPEGWQLVEWSTAPILDESGECVGVQAIGRDVTEQRLVEERVQNTERKWRTLFEQATVGVMLVSRDHHIVEANPRAAELLGYSREELHTLSATDLIHPDDYAETSPDETLRTITRERRAVETERRFRRKDGRYINALVSMTRLEGLPQEISHAVMFSDISERKRVEEQLRASVAERDALMTELSHRVKNNLAMVSSLISLKDGAMRDAADLSDIQQHIEAVRSVYEMLHSSDRGAEIDVREYMNKLITAVFPSLPGSRLSIEVDVPNMDIPAQTAMRLGIIVNELATNAVKHGFSGEGPHRFTVKLSRDEERQEWVLTVSNSGRPFPAEIDLQTTESLGLRLVSALAGQLDGELSLRREPTPQFTIRLPAEAVSVDRGDPGDDH